MWLHYTRRSKRLVKRLSPAFPWRASWHWAQYDFGASINRLGLETWDERGEWYGIWNDNVDVHPTKITTLICWDFFRKWWSMLRHIVNKNISHCSSSEWRFSCGWRALPFNATRHNEPRMTKENPKITPQNPHAQPSPACNKPSKRLHSSAHIVESHCRLVPTIPSIQKGAIRTGLLRFWHLGAKTTPIVAHCSSHFDVPLLWVITRIIPSTCYPSQKPFALFIKKTTSTYINIINHQPHQPHGPSPFNQKKNSPPPLDRTKKLMARAVPCFLAILGSVRVTGCYGVNSQIVRAFNFLGKQAILWVGHAGHLCGRWVAYIFWLMF